MKVLGLDTATGACSAAVWDDGRVLAARRQHMQRGQAEALLPLLLATLEAAGVTFAALDRLAVTVGPGSFTGLRVGLATARGLALASGCPLLGITTFAAVAQELSAAERAGARVLVAVESRRDELFLQLYDAAVQPEGAPQVLAPAAVPAWLPPGPLLVAGDGASRLVANLAVRPETRFAAGDGCPDPGVVAALGAEAPLPAHLPTVLYLRPPDARLPG